jgi:class 3 adenylate cyclase
VNLAARLCSEAGGGQVLLDPRTYAAVEDRVAAASVGPLTLKGFHRPVQAYLVTRQKPASRASQ